MSNILRKDAGPDVCNVRKVQELASQTQAIFSSPTMWSNVQLSRQRIVECMDVENVGPSSQKNIGQQKN